MVSKEPSTNNPMSGDYDSCSPNQLKANLRNVPFLIEALTISDANGQVLHIGDFGSATGLNSMKTFSQAFTSFRETSDSQISVHHVDIPSNNWGLLFNNAVNSPYSYLNIKGTFVEAVGRSNYVRVFPDNFLSIVYSTYSLHWLSRPVDTPDLFHRYLTNAAEVVQEASVISEEDLDKFLLYRTAELKVGGRMILHTPSTQYDQTNAYTVYQSMITDGLVPAETIENISILMYNRSEAEFRKSVSKLSDRLRILNLTVSDEPSPLLQKYLEDHDKEAYVSAFCKLTRAASGNVWRKVMRLPEGPHPLLDEFYRRSEISMMDSLCRRPPTRHLLVVLEKIA